MGSVDRYTDFTRSFYPLQDSDKRRWTNIEVRAYDQIGLPPIEVYQIGEAYFVLDGNHRVSVAREMEATHIEAYVTKVQTRLALSPEADRESPAVQFIKAEFNQRCVKAGIPGKLAVEAARWPKRYAPGPVGPIWL